MMEKIIAHFGDALLSRDLTALNLVLLLAAGYLIWQLHSERNAREAEREAVRQDAKARIEAFEALAIALSEMKGIVSRLR